MWIAFHGAETWTFLLIPTYLVIEKPTRPVSLGLCVHEYVCVRAHTCVYKCACMGRPEAMTSIPQVQSTLLFWERSLTDQNLPSELDWLARHLLSSSPQSWDHRLLYFIWGLTSGLLVSTSLSHQSFPFASTILELHPMIFSVSSSHRIFNVFQLIYYSRL